MINGTNMEDNDGKISVMTDMWHPMALHPSQGHGTISNRCASLIRPPARENLEYVRNLISPGAVSSAGGSPGSAFDPNLSKEIYTIGSMLQRILYIQAARQYCIVHTDDNETVELRLSLKEITLRFNEDQLLQVHRSYLVNPEHVFSIKLSRTRGWISVLPGGVFQWEEVTGQLF